jgi:hypothetical protein
MMSTLSRAMLFPLLELSWVPVQVMVRVCVPSLMVGLVQTTPLSGCRRQRICP